MTEIEIPSTRDLYDPVVQALHRLGGTGMRNEIYEEVIDIIGLTLEHESMLQDRDRNYESILKSRVGWAQSKLKRQGFLANPSRGVWTLTAKGQNMTNANPKEIVRIIESARKSEEAQEQTDSPVNSDNTDITQVSIPTLDKLINPMLFVLHRLDGSGTNDEIDKGVADLLQLTGKQLKVLHESGKGTRTEVAYRLSFARTYLKKYGLLDNPERKVWALTEKGSTVLRVNPFAVILHAQRKMLEERLERERNILPDLTDIDQTLSW